MASGYDISASYSKSQQLKSGDIGAATPYTIIDNSMVVGGGAQQTKGDTGAGLGGGGSSGTNLALVAGIALVVLIGFKFLNK